jgi:hypothetical protein
VAPSAIFIKSYARFRFEKRKKVLKLKEFYIFPSEKVGGDKMRVIIIWEGTEGREMSLNLENLNETFWHPKIKIDLKLGTLINLKVYSMAAWYLCRICNVQYNTERWFS